MPFSINTNIASLQAQNYLQQTSQFQQKTINSVTSGLRIVNSGDDAAGLAVANADRSNEAVLTQGVQNANDGMSQLQIADSGMSNISQLLDRARTLATESASQTFTGDRSVLNSEFQSVIQEVNRQSQSIGLNQGGTFAQNLQVFIGGGQSSNGVSAIANGTVSLNLSQATVDAKSLGLQGVQAAGVANTDIGTGSNTSVQTIVQNANNLTSISNNTTNFSFTGPGFANADGNNTIQVGVNLSGVTDTNTLVAAINQAIQNAGNGDTQQATAFANANITASIVTNAAGQSQLAFSSSSSAFQVQGDDKVATALLGEFKSSGTMGEGITATVGTAVSGAGSVGAYTAPGAAETGVKIRLTGAGLNGAAANDLSVNIGTTDTIQTVVSNINTAIAANATVAATGVQAVVSGTKIQFVGPTGTSFTASTAGDVQDALGFGSWASAAGTATTAGNYNYGSITAANAFSGLTAATTEGMQISINGGPAINLGTQTTGASEGANIDSLNALFQGNAATRAARIIASDNGGNIEISSANSVNFRLNFYGAGGSAGDALGFGAAATGSTNSGLAAYGTSYTGGKDSINSAGAQSSVNSGVNSDVYQFTGLQNYGDAQTVTLSTVDTNGVLHSLNVNLNTSNAGNLDQAVSTINAAISASNDTTLGQMAAFKEQGTSGLVNGVEGIRFMSAGDAFKVSLGASDPNAAGTSVGLSDGGTGATGGAVLTSTLNGAGSTADISNFSTATAAVNQLATSVDKLGSAQAAVGRGENEFNYAINLASSQLTNLAAAESGVRDANMATESANLTKASIQLQAGIAALAQANSAPQQILSLLQH